MIKPDCHTLDWIKAHGDTLGMTNVDILERAIFALTLLAALSRTKLDFVFKGGTALLLHLPEPQRLSIDIDIVCNTDRPTLESAFNAILPETPFVRWEEHVRGQNRLPKRLHFKFHYESPLHNGAQMPVLLDVVTEPNVIQDLVRKPLITSFIESSELIEIILPSQNALLGDKLTAFAPNTIGVPLTEDYSQQVIKQLFDIGQLYDHVTDPAALASANFATFEAERGYRNLQIEYHTYLDDVIASSYLICGIDVRDFERLPQMELYRRGVSQMANHLIRSKFRLPLEVKIAAAKAAALASVLKRAAIPERLPVFDPLETVSLRERMLLEQHRNLRRILATNPAAYFYWTTLGE